ncbi:MAG: radical SAM protein [Candidatus Omnitrophota bacterium]|nr:radical SAM protein [Candidatus Omnitrophota bacterium]
MTQKVLLINPPEAGRGDYSTAPLGLLYLAAVLKKNNITVDFIDGYLSGWEGIEKKVEEYMPSIAGITCHTYARQKALKAAAMVKAKAPGAIVVLGGAHATLMYRQLLEHYGVVDITVRGEGEATFLEICQGKDLEDINGIAYRDGSGIAVNSERALVANLDELPFPSWEMVDFKKYPPDGCGVYNGIDIGKEPCVPVVFSRGCIGSCVFCCDKLIWKRWRRRSPVNMADELEILNKRYGIKRFNFNDDLFTADRSAAACLCEEIIKRGLIIAFEIVSRTDCLDIDLLKLLKKAGCFKICFGIETASPELLKRMKKFIAPGLSEKAIMLTRSVGIRASALLIAGNLGETRDTINETVDFINRANPDETGLANGLRVLPGTELYEHAKEIGFINDDFWLTDYHWKIFTAENSKLSLNIFCEALRRKERLPIFRAADMLIYRRFYWKAVEDSFKSLLSRAGIAKRKKRAGKYEVAY